MATVSKLDPPKENADTNKARASTAAPKLAYGKNSASKQDEHDVNERVHTLHHENLKLKEKENFLELEIKKYA